MLYSKGGSVAKNLLNICGIDEITKIKLEELVSYRGAILVEQNISNGDGRIVHGIKRSIIVINSNIIYNSRKRFTIAHELGHLEMHKDFPIHNDQKSLDWFAETFHKLKYGTQELEANQFASELLMPSELFKSEILKRKFNPALIIYLADRFQTSLTAVAYKFAEMNILPICIFYISNGIVKSWKKSDGFKYSIVDRVKLRPHKNSVASEYIEAEYESIYSIEDLQQKIDKSTWFNLDEDDEEEDFFEFCIPTKQYKTLISIVWQD